MDVVSLKLEYLEKFEEWLKKAFIGHSEYNKELLEMAKGLYSLDEVFDVELFRAISTIKNLYIYE